MSDDLFVFTDVLPLPEAKKLLTFLQKPGKKGAWEDWSGEGGFETLVELERISGEEVGRIVLPAYVTGIKVEVDEMIASAPGAVPETLFLGGDDWIIPDYDCSSDVRFEVVDPELDYPMLFSFGKDTNRRFYGRAFNECDLFVFQPALAKADFPVLPSEEASNALIARLAERFGFSDIKNQGLLEETGVRGGFAYYFDPRKNHWLRENFRAMAVALVERPAQNGSGCWSSSILEIP